MYYQSLQVTSFCTLLWALKVYNNTKDFAVHFQRLDFEKAASLSEPSVPWLRCFCAPQKFLLKNGKPMAYQPPLAPFSSHILRNWQLVFSPKIGQRKMKTDGPDGALAGALTCSLQAPRDLLYSFPPSLSLLFALFSVILFHVAHGTNKYRGTPSTYTNADCDLSISPCPSAGQVTSFFPELDRQPWLTNHEDRLSCPLLRSKNQLFFFAVFNESFIKFGATLEDQIWVLLQRKPSLGLM